MGTSESQRRTLQQWREARQLTPEDLARAGAGISPEVIQEWEADGEPPTAAMPSLISVARALGVPLDQLDLGPIRRGFDAGGYSFVLYARSRNGRNHQEWRARIGLWGWPDGGPSPAIADRVSTKVTSAGPSAEAALDALEAELRELIGAARSEAERSPDTLAV